MASGLWDRVVCQAHAERGAGLGFSLSMYRVHGKSLVLSLRVFCEAKTVLKFKTNLKSKRNKIPKTRRVDTIIFINNNKFINTGLNNKN